MIVFPNCKINLGLHILRSRADGFHDIETIFYPVPFMDVLEIIPQHPHSKEQITLTTSGIPIEGTPNTNLCVKAFHLLKKDFPSLCSIQMHLHKVIPTGAGLGGGSSDASYTLKLLNELGNLELTQEQLIKYATLLGSDCPFFIINNSCYATGRGEQLEEIPLDLSSYKLILVNPGLHIDTKNAFSKITPGIPETSIKDTSRLPVSDWKNKLTNDFEKVVFKSHPEIENIKTELYRTGAIYASMSGSGSTVFGIFEKKQAIFHSFPVHYFVKTINSL